MNVETLRCLRRSSGGRLCLHMKGVCSQTTHSFILLHTTVIGERFVCSANGSPNTTPGGATSAADTRTAVGQVDFQGR